MPEAVIVSSTAPHCTCAVRMRSGSSARPDPTGQPNREPEQRSHSHHCIGDALAALASQEGGVYWAIHSVHGSFLLLSSV